MRLRRRHRSPARPDPLVDRRRGAGLVVQLHGYGAGPLQFTTLLPLSVGATIVPPFGPDVVPPGRGWWVPDDRPDGLVELAPATAVDAAVADVITVTTAWQAHLGVGPAATALVGYSQGAGLALEVLARRPDLVGAVATAAGFLLPGAVVEAATPGSVLVANGSLDPIVTTADHDDTVRRLRAAGHDVTSRRDAVPHVIDLEQAAAIDTHLVRFFTDAPA